jgi:hypothetical protein
VLLTVLARAVELGEQIGAAAVHRRRAYEQARKAGCGMSESGARTWR